MSATEIPRLRVALSRSKIRGSPVTFHLAEGLLDGRYNHRFSDHSVFTITWASQGFPTFDDDDEDTAFMYDPAAADSGEEEGAGKRLSFSG